MDRVIVTAVERAKGAFETLTHLPWRPGLGRHPSRGESSAAPALAALLPPRQSILVTGGTGFIGARLCEILIEEGHQVTVLTRDPRNGRRFRGRVTLIDNLATLGRDTRFDAIVNLAGEPVVAGRWTAQRRRALIDSRLATTRAVVRFIARSALARMLLPFELGFGGRMGSGRQWMSWIHRDDLVGLIIHAIAVETVRGPLNGTAPEPVRNADFARALGRALHRPALLPLPGFALRWALGQLAEEVLLGGQRVLPRKAAETGYQFLYPNLQEALNQIVG